MRQSKFNYLVKQFIKMKSAEAVSKMLRAEGLPLVDQLNSLKKIKDALEQQLNETNNYINEIDEEINSLFTMLSNSNTLEDKTKKITDESIMDKIQTLSHNKSLLQSEALIIQTKLNENKQSLSSVYENRNFLYYCYGETKFDKEKETFINEIQEAVQADNPELDSKSISAAVTSTLEMDNLKIYETTDFTEKLNHLCKSDFDYNLSYDELLQNISSILNSKYWEHLVKDQGLNEIIRLRKIVTDRDDKSDEKTYLQLQEFSKKILKKCSIKNKDSDLAVLARAIINSDLIGIGTISEKMELINAVNKPHNKTIIFDIEKIHPELIRCYETRIEKQFDDLVDLYLLAKAAGVVTDETAILIQKIIDELKALESEISQLEGNLVSKIEDLRSIEIESEKKNKEYEGNLEKYPTVQELIDKKYGEDKQSDNTKKFISSNEIETLRHAIHQKKKMRNNKMLQHLEKLEQYLAITNLAGHLKETFAEKFSKMFKQYNPDVTDENVNIIAKEIYDPETKALQGSLPDNLNSLYKIDLKYTITYQDFIKKIYDLVNHSHWLALKKKGSNVQGIEEISKILSDKSLTSETCFDLVVQNASKLLKKSNSFWGNKIHPDVKQLCKTIVDKSIFKLNQLAFHFDFLSEQAKFIAFKV